MNPLVDKLKNYIKDQFGIVVNSQMEKDLIPFFDKHKEKIATYNWAEKISTEDFQDLINKITVTETYFFRDKPQINYLTNLIQQKVDKLINSFNKKLVFWSVGASGGEEAYTLAIVLSELGILNSTLYKIKIFGFDINTQNIQKANNGIYSKWSFRGMNEDQISTHFTKTEKGLYKINENLKKNVFFFHFNIKKDLFDKDICLKYEKPDFIICRNTIMYFENKDITNITDRFCDLLDEEGFLIPGIQEVSLFNNKKIILENINGSFIFQKNFKITQKKYKEKIQTSILKKQFEEDFKKKQKNKISKKNELKSKVNYEDEVKKDTYHDFLKIFFTYFNLNHFDKILKLCDIFISNNQTNYVGYYMKSFVYFKQDKNEEALENIKKAIFLNDNSPLTYSLCGSILLKLNLEAKAKFYFQKALDSFNKIDANEKELVLLLNISETNLIDEIKIKINSIEEIK
ncbi:MAG: CheR family methyltransferase [Candidatus Sericytochromatia bacterium]